MNVFVTGATGWIGSAVVDQLLAAGHDVTGLARTGAAAETLRGKGVRPHRGDLDDLDSLRSGARDADAVVHLANKHDWGNPAATNATERAAVQTFGDMLAGSGRALVVASGLAGLPVPATEQDPSPFHGPDAMRGGSENLARDFAQRGVHSIAVRFAPTTHGAGDHGFLAGIVAAARDAGESGFIGEGGNRWAAVHRDDAADLVRRALESEVPPGAVLHAVAETGISTREIAEAIGRHLDLPVVSVALESFGWLARFWSADIAADSAATQALLDWVPTGPGLLADIVHY